MTSLLNGWRLFRANDSRSLSASVGEAMKYAKGEGKEGIFTRFLRTFVALCLELTIHVMSFCAVRNGESTSTRFRGLDDDGRRISSSFATFTATDKGYGASSNFRPSTVHLNKCLSSSSYSGPADLNSWSFPTFLGQSSLVAKVTSLG